MADRKYKVVIAQSGNHLLFFIVDEYKATVTVLRVLQDGMDWQYIIKKWLKENS